MQILIISEMPFLLLLDIFQGFCNLLEPECFKANASTIFSIITATLSVLALLINYNNTSRSLSDKNRQIIIENMAKLFVLFKTSPIDNDQWIKLGGGEYINTAHQLHEWIITNTLSDSTAAKNLKDEIEKLRTEKPSTQKEIDDRLKSIEEKYKSWVKE